MIAGSELRIGNFVDSRYGQKEKPIIVRSVSEKGINLFLYQEQGIGSSIEPDFHFSEDFQIAVEGIQLTEEWLLKFGLNKVVRYPHEVLYTLDEGGFIGIGYHKENWYVVSFQTEA